MTNSATQWFSPAPSEVTSSRISLDFNLRAADLFFRELVVPELGRVWFVRQLSWPLAALALYEELASRGSGAPKPTAICHGIEALACKLQYLDAPEDPSPRILGRRAFGRDVERELWSFDRLRQPANYVRNTHRQAATRALRVDGGLGFARGSRFDLLGLTDVGKELADAFLSQKVGKPALRDWLVGWVRGEKDVPVKRPKLTEVLSPDSPTPEEREVVRRRLFDVSSLESEKRHHLAVAIGRAADLPNVGNVVVERLRDAGRRKQADEVVAAFAFGAVLDRARGVVAKLTRAIEPERGGVQLAKLAHAPALKRAMKDLRAIAVGYAQKADAANVAEPASRAFADAVAAANDCDAIKLVVSRAGEVLGLADGSVVRGALFRVIDATHDVADPEEGSAEPDWTGRTFRIANLHALMRDVDQRGAR